MIENGRPRAAAASKVTVLCYQHHGCLYASHTSTHLRSTESPGEGQIFIPCSVTVAYGSEAQLYEMKECMIVHFAATDATLTTYLPAHRMHECRCKGSLCTDGIGNSVEV